MFGHAVGSHGAPFIVITAEPNFREIGKGVIRGDFRWREVIVIVEEGRVGGEVVVELASSIVAQKEVVVNEGRISRLDWGFWIKEFGKSRRAIAHLDYRSDVVEEV